MWHSGLGGARLLRNIDTRALTQSQTRFADARNCFRGQSAHLNERSNTNGTRQARPSVTRFPHCIAPSTNLAVQYSA